MQPYANTRWDVSAEEASILKGLASARAQRLDNGKGSLEVTDSEVPLLLETVAYKHLISLIERWRVIEDLVRDQSIAYPVEKVSLSPRFASRP